MYGYPANYNPHHPRQQPDPPGEVPPHSFRAAQRANASHLSPDGKMAYVRRLNKILKADFDGHEFGAWLEIDALPGEAVELP